MVRFSKKEEWVTWMHGLGELDVQWTSPWWNFLNVSMRTLNSYIAFASLRDTSFYPTMKITRQCGVK